MYEIGIINREIILYFGLSGLLIRSSGILLDFRLYGYEIYYLCPFNSYISFVSDCLDRYLCRFNEFIESSRIIYFSLHAILSNNNNTIQSNTHHIDNNLSNSSNRNNEQQHTHTLLNTFHSIPASNFNYMESIIYEFLFINQSSFHSNNYTNIKDNISTNNITNTNNILNNPLLFFNHRNRQSNTSNNSSAYTSQTSFNGIHTYTEHNTDRHNNTNIKIPNNSFSNRNIAMHNIPHTSIDSIPQIIQNNSLINTSNNNTYGNSNRNQSKSNLEQHITNNSYTNLLIPIGNSNNKEQHNTDIKSNPHHTHTSTIEKYIGNPINNITTNQSYYNPSATEINNITQSTTYNSFSNHSLWDSTNNKVQRTIHNNYYNPLLFFTHTSTNRNSIPYGIHKDRNNNSIEQHTSLSNNIFSNYSNHSSNSITNNNKSTLSNNIDSNPIDSSQNNNIKSNNKEQQLLNTSSSTNTERRLNSIHSSHTSNNIEINTSFPINNSSYQTIVSFPTNNYSSINNTFLSSFNNTNHNVNSLLYGNYNKRINSNTYTSAIPINNSINSSNSYGINRTNNSMGNTSYNSIKLHTNNYTHPIDNINNLSTHSSHQLHHFNSNSAAVYVSIESSYNTIQNTYIRQFINNNTSNYCSATSHLSNNNYSITNNNNSHSNDRHTKSNYYSTITTHNNNNLYANFSSQTYASSTAIYTSIESSKGIYSLFLCMANYNIHSFTINFIASDFLSINALNKYSKNINLADLIAVLGSIDFVLGSVDA